MSTETTAFVSPPRHTREVLRVDERPQSWRGWLADVWAHREVLSLLARTNFHVRYKRVSFGVLWAVAIPVIQAAALAFVFSHFIHTRGHFSYVAFAVSGVLAWGYFSPTLSSASTAIVDGAGLTDKVWFPRSLLVLVPCLANIPSFLISLVLLLIVLPLFGASFGPHVLLLLPATALLVTFAIALSLLLAAVHVYFRDVRYLVQAALLVLFYMTPIVYTQVGLGGAGPYMDINPLTGLADLFHWAAVGHPSLWSPHALRAIAWTVAVNLLLLVVAIELHRRRDRLFVDLL